MRLKSLRSLLVFEKAFFGRMPRRSYKSAGRYMKMISAPKNHRFPPIQAKELPYLEYTVSILTDYEVADHYLDWEVCAYLFVLCGAFRKNPKVMFNSSVQLSNHNSAAFSVQCLV
ncbi:hypothetical protein QN277_007587 [Acacia crassicarpa]|uniref:AMMECR1 domain-containing protein n=1 Tax=Acacia crassicarpa TaxID=499986 RepID=A0AAE1IV47_9FABA|nr:hypothetical protein QN277_007587 [Acacia crassicarpa]